MLRPGVGPCAGGVGCGVGGLLFIHPAVADLLPGWRSLAGNLAMEAATGGRRKILGP